MSVRRIGCFQCQDVKRTWSISNYWDQSLICLLLRWWWRYPIVCWVSRLKRKQEVKSFRLSTHTCSLSYLPCLDLHFIIYTLHTPEKIVVRYTWHSCIFIHYTHLTHLQAQLHSVCTGGCIVYSTVLSSWCTITVLHTMHCTEVHCTELQWM